MEKIKNYIKNYNELISKIEYLHDTLKTKGKLIKTNRKENSFFSVSKSTKYNYDTKENVNLVSYRIYQAYGMEYEIDFNENEKIENVLEKIKENIKNRKNKVIEINALLKPERIEKIKQERLNLLKNLDDALNQLQEFRNNLFVLNNDLYKELLGIDYLKHFYQREY